MSFTQSISKKAKIGKNVEIGLFTIIGDNVIIGDNTVIESHCVIGYPTKLAKGKPLVIGENSHIRSHSVFYEGSTFGPRLTTGHSVFVRENTAAGKGLQIGTQSDIQGDCRFGDWVKMHSDVHIAKESIIDDFVWLFPRTQFTNDPFPPSNICEGIHIKDMAVISTESLLLPGITIGKGSFVGAGSIVRTDVPDIHCVSGDPARIFATLDSFINFKHGIAHPWPKHFRRGYPEESFARMDEIVEEINRLIEERRKAKRKGNKT
ncbi:MAG: N-acetyltransferase [candidate division Zixibacteria bacterium]|nr:N-acetyltransferase [candidate division Zixibacteria bacterium]